MRIIAGLVAVAVAGLVTGSQGQALPGAIEEWTVPWEKSRPRDPAVAPDGRIWFGTDNNTLGKAAVGKAAKPSA